MDVEDLSALARSSGPCVYFFTRRLAEISDLVFLPYNYLIEKQTRQGIESLFNWKGSIVIFDEAHNIEVRNLSFSQSTCFARFSNAVPMPRPSI